MNVRVAFAALGNRPDEIVALALEGERLGFSRVWFGDHLAQPSQQSSVYPYSETPLTLTTVDYVDPLVQAAAIAGATSRIEIGTAVYLLPMHHPLVVARAVGTLQTAARGRFHFGVGLGWMPEEFAAIDVPFNRRGRRMDEALEILRLAQAGGPFAYSGREFSFAEVEITHRAIPVRLVLGGASAPALRRAARYGDGWYSTPTDSVADIVAKRDEIELLRQEFGTAGRPFTYYVRISALDPELLASFVAEGFAEFTLGSTELFPRAEVAAMTLEDKFDVLGRVADEFGVAG